MANDRSIDASKEKSTGKLMKCGIYNYDFVFNGQRNRGSTECTGNTRAKQFEKDLRERLGNEVAAGLTESRMLDCRKKRRKEGAGPCTIDLELSVLSRAFGAKWSVYCGRN
jgi:hypothetical protein